ncbi:MAG: methionine--tRNA ligase subunit beta, partial [Steroidobacteraceae bacterium]
IDQHKPWLLAKDTDRASDVHGVCTQAINLFRVLILLLKPVLPQLVAKAEAFLGGTELEWDDVQRPLLGSKIDNYEPLATRIDPAAVKSLVAVNQQVVASSTPASTNNVVKVESSKSVANNEASIDDFAKLDLRIAKITNAELVDGADKLLKLTVDLGTELGTRTIFAGIRSAYEPAQLIGRLTLVFANLKPRKMRFGVSEGMMLAAGSDTKAGDKSATKEIFILSPDSGAVPGMKVK